MRHHHTFTDENETTETGSARGPRGPSEVRAAADAPVPAVGPVVEAAASADPGAGSRVTCPAPTTRRSGSSGDFPMAGSTSSRSPRTAKR